MLSGSANAHLTAVYRLPLQSSVLLCVCVCVCRHASWHPGDLPRDAALQASDDVLGDAQQGDPPRLQEVHARCNYTAARLTATIWLFTLCFASTTSSFVVIRHPADKLLGWRIGQIVVHGLLRDADTKTSLPLSFLLVDSMPLVSVGVILTSRVSCRFCYLWFFVIFSMFLGDHFRHCHQHCICSAV